MIAARFGHPAVALAQLDAVAARELDQLLQRPMTETRIRRMRDCLRLHRGVDHHALQIARRQRLGLVCHRQALLQQRRQRLLAQPLPPMRQ
jgi:hypothetical protein